MACDSVARLRSPPPPSLPHINDTDVSKDGLDQGFSDGSSSLSDLKATLVSSTTSDAYQEYSMSLADQESTSVPGVAYLERLRSAALDDPNLLNLVYPITVDTDKVFLFEHRGRIYTLRPSHYSLLHQTHGKTSGIGTLSKFICLAYRDNKLVQKDVTFFAYQSAMNTEDRAAYVGPSIFIPLGFLMEEERSPEGKFEYRCCSNYVLCWNISTRPTSLWVVYDYFTMLPEGGFSYNTLREHGEHDYPTEQELQDLMDVVEATVESTEDKLRATQSEEEGHFCCFGHENDEREEFGDLEAPQRLTIENYDHIGTATHYGCQNGTLKPRYKDAWVQDHPIVPGIDSEFDVAMLYPNAQDWFTNRSLDVDRLSSCANSNRFLLGSHLRAAYAKREWVDEVLEQNIGALYLPSRGERSSA